VYILNIFNIEDCSDLVELDVKPYYTIPIVILKYGLEVTYPVNLCTVSRSKFFTDPVLFSAADSMGLSSITCAQRAPAKDSIENSILLDHLGLGPHPIRCCIMVV